MSASSLALINDMLPAMPPTVVVHQSAVLMSPWPLSMSRFCPGIQALHFAQNVVIRLAFSEQISMLSSCFFNRFYTVRSCWSVLGDLCRAIHIVFKRSVLVHLFI